MTHLVLDTESVPLADAADFLEPATAPANYKSPDAIADYIAKANAEQIAKAALDVDLARLVAIGVHSGEGSLVTLCRTEEEERQALIAFWIRVNDLGPRPHLIGFNCLGFDLPLLLRRSLYLGVEAPRLQIGKYRHDGIDDLMLSLSFDGALRYRSLSFYKRRFKLDVPDDPHTGADIAALVKAGDWAGVKAHCLSDLETTLALAKRTGVI